MKSTIGSVLDEFECGCFIIKEDEWKWQMVTCMSHSRPREGGGLERYIDLNKPIREMTHP